MTEDIDLRIIDLIYSAATDAGLWPDALTWMAREFAAPCATILPMSHAFDVMSSPGLEDAQSAYADQWWTLDTMNNDLARRAFPLGPYNDWENLPLDQIARDSYYQDFRARFGLGHMMGLITRPHPDGIVAIGLQLAVGRETPDASKVRRFRFLAGHAERSLAIACRVTSLENRYRNLAEALSMLDHGAAIVDHCGKVMAANPALIAMHASGMRVGRDGLRCARSADQVALDRLIGACFSASVAFKGPDQIAIARDGGLHPLIVRAIPLGAAQRDGPWMPSEHFKQALVVLVDPDRHRKPAVEHRLVLLGLTRSEARVAALVGGGMAPALAAEISNLSVQTVRTMLKQIFQKLKVSRQNELSALVAKLW